MSIMAQVTECVTTPQTSNMFSLQYETLQLQDLGRRELDHVAHQVRNNLAEPKKPAGEQVRDVWVDVIPEIKLLLRRTHDLHLKNVKHRPQYRV